MKITDYMFNNNKDKMFIKKVEQIKCEVVKTSSDFIGAYGRFKCNCIYPEQQNIMLIESPIKLIMDECSEQHLDWIIINIVGLKSKEEMNKAIQWICNNNNSLFIDIKEDKKGCIYNLSTSN